MIISVVIGLVMLLVCCNQDKVRLENSYFVSTDKPVVLEGEHILERITVMFIKMESIPTETDRNVIYERVSKQHFAIEFKVTIRRTCEFMVDVFVSDNRYVGPDSYEMTVYLLSLELSIDFVIRTVIRFTGENYKGGIAQSFYIAEATIDQNEIRWIYDFKRIC
jgi:hypothetical protein